MRIKHIGLLSIGLTFILMMLTMKNKSSLSLDSERKVNREVASVSISIEKFDMDNFMDSDLDLSMDADIVEYLQKKIGENSCKLIMSHKSQLDKGDYKKSLVKLKNKQKDLKALKEDCVKLGTLQIQEMDAKDFDREFSVDNITIFESREVEYDDVYKMTNSIYDFQLELNELQNAKKRKAYSKEKSEKFSDYIQYASAKLNQLKSCQSKAEIVIEDLKKEMVKKEVQYAICKQLNTACEDNNNSCNMDFGQLPLKTIIWCMKSDKEWLVECVKQSIHKYRESYSEQLQLNNKNHYQNNRSHQK